MSKVILIDGKNFCYRHGWTHRELRYNKVPTGMLYGAITGIVRLARLHPDTVLAFCWDGVDSHNSWRHKLCPDYKSNRKVIVAATEAERKKHEWKVAMNIQIPLLKKFIDMMGFKQLEVDALEADDLIGILSRHLKPMADKVLIYSTDRDFYQLMSNRVKVVRDQDKTKKCRPHRTKDVMKEFGISPKDWLKYRALVGDKGDKIDNVKGIGPVTALKFLAAGVDASTTEPNSRFKLKGDGWKFGHAKGLVVTKANWKLMRLNYLLSRILTDPNADQLSETESKQIRAFLRQLKSLGDLDRLKRKDGYKKMEKFLAKYGFEELMTRRKEIWNLK